MKELEELRQIFLADVDEETRAENEDQIIEWERDLRENEAILGWRDHDITKRLAQQARDSYRDIAIRLSVDRALTDEHRRSLWARQDACLFIMSLTEVDAKSAIDRINAQVREALNATKV